MAKTAGKNDNLNKLFPITVMFGDQAEGNWTLAQAIGLRQNEDNPDKSDLKYTGRGWSGDAGMSVRTKTLPVHVSEVFNLLTAAHEQGQVADLTDTALAEQSLINKPSR